MFNFSKKNCNVSSHVNITQVCSQLNSISPRIFASYVWNKGQRWREQACWREHYLESGFRRLLHCKFAISYAVQKEYHDWCMLGPMLPLANGSQRIVRWSRHCCVLQKDSFQALQCDSYWSETQREFLKTRALLYLIVLTVSCHWSAPKLAHTVWLLV